jgi:hypothetical protein
MDITSSFMEKAKGFIKNPLGIIALFISLIYGFACLILGLSFDHFKNEIERLPLIWFIITFPILILVAFIYLVVKHHNKLYAPGDYKDEGNFFRTLDPAHQRLRLLNEIETIQKDSSEGLPENGISDQTAQKIIKSESDTANLKDKYLIAEDLALRAFEQGRNLTIKRHMRIVGKKAATADFDALAFDQDFIYGIDVRFTIHGHLSKVLREKITTSFKDYRKDVKELDFIGTLKVIVIVVSENGNISALKNELDELVSQAEFPLETYVYHFTELKRRFGY